jgi:hypothetical protein
MNDDDADLSFYEYTHVLSGIHETLLSACVFLEIFTTRACASKRVEIKDFELLK